MDKEQLLKLVEANLDMPGLVADVLDQVAKPALEKVVADSENKFDDMALAALYPSLVPVIKEEIGKLWDKVDGAVGSEG